MIRRSVGVFAVSLLAATSLFASDGVQAAVDAKGNLRQPTMAEQRALAAGTQSKSLMRLQPKVHATGMVSIELDESFDHAFVIRMDEEGQFAFVCTDDHNEAASFKASSASLDTILRIKPAATRDFRNAERE